MPRRKTDEAAKKTVDDVPTTTAGASLKPAATITTGVPPAVTPDKQNNQQPSNNLQSETQPSTDEHEPKQQKIEIWYFELEDGTATTLRSYSEATYFLDEYDQSVKLQKQFSSEKEYKAYLIQRKMQKTRHSPNGCNQNTAVDPDTKDRADKILANYEKYKAKNKLQLKFKSIPISNLVIVLPQFMDIRGKPLFYAKPRNLTPYAKSYFDTEGWNEISVSEDPVVKHMINNLSHAKVRDPDGPPDKVLATKTKRGNFIEEETMVTELFLPESGMNAIETEDEYVRKHLKLFGESILAAFATDTFKCVMYNGMTDATFEWMYKKSFTFQQWCQEATIEMERIDNLNTYIVLEDSNRLKRRMLNYKCSMRYHPEIPSHRRDDTGAIHMQMVESPIGMENE